MLFASFIIALLTGMGVGSGGLFVIYLTLVRGVEQLAAQGLNLYFFIFSTAAGALIHIRSKKFPTLRILLICLVGSVGCAFGAIVAKNIDTNLLRQFFAFLLIACGIISLGSGKKGGNFFKKVFTNKK